MAFCLTAEGVKKFREGLKDGTIGANLFDMTPTARHGLFAGKFGEGAAKEINALFESKLRLQDQIRGFETFAKKIGELAVKEGKLVPKDIQTHQDKLIAKINGLKDALTPAQVEQYKKDFISKVFGGEVSLEQAQTLTTLAKQIAESKVAAEAIINKPGFSLKNESKADRIERVKYGVSVATLKEYMASIKTGEINQNLDTTKGKLKSIYGDFATAFKNPKQLPIFIGNLSKSIVASLDNSFFLNQGANALFDPKTTSKWLTAFGKSWVDIGRALKGGNPILGLRGEIYSRPNALNGVYETANLSIGLHTEEAIPTTIADKTPVVGRLFKASNDAYNGAALRLRADIFDMEYANNVKKGIDMTNKVNLKSLGERINAFTGRGKLNTSGETTGALFFSPKFLKSKFDVMTAHVFSDTMTSADKAKAAGSLLRLYGTVAAIMALSNIIKPGSAEIDPRATNYGKIKIGNTWYPTPITFGGIPTLLARTIIPTMHNGQWGLWSKNGNGKWTSLLLFKNGAPIIPKFGAVTAKDITEGFFENKGAPLLHALLDLWNGKDFNGHPSTPANLGINLVKPISDGQIIDILRNHKETNPAIASFLTFIGENVSTAK